MKKVIILLSVLFLFTSCSKISVYKTSKFKGDDKENVDGVRFYRPKPYLKVMTGVISDKINTKSTEVTDNTLFSEPKEHNDKMKQIKITKTVIPTGPESSITYEIIWLPDYDEEYIIQWDAAIGSVKPNFTLTDGWKLTGFSSEVDTKIADTLTSLVGSYVSYKTADREKTSKRIVPGIYPIEFKNGVLFVDKKNPVIKFE
jgi:hypothetical protein